jgi:hypothetical protein
MPLLMPLPCMRIILTAIAKRLGEMVSAATFYCLVIADELAGACDAAVFLEASRGEYDVVVGARMASTRRAGVRPESPARN